MSNGEICSHLFPTGGVSILNLNTCQKATNELAIRSAISSMQVSGKLVILTILAVAIPGAGASWWFRYSATHHAAKFWGPEAARLIRDAKQVELLKLAPSMSTEAGQNEVKLHGEVYLIELRRDASAAPGLTHLRNALLLDRSYEFNAVFEPPRSHRWRWALTFPFREAQKSATLLFDDRCFIICLEGNGVASCRPIAEGLSEVFAEIAARSQ